MPKNKGKGRRFGRKSGPKVTGQSSLTAYKGPIIPAGFRAGNESFRTRLTFVQTISSDGGGLLAGNLINGASGFTNFSQFAALFGEFRVLAHRVKYMPGSIGFTTVGALLNGAMVWTIARNPAFAFPTTLLAAYDDSGAIIGNTSLPKTISVRASGFPELDWINTTGAGSGLSTWEVNYVAAGLTASQVYGTIFQEILVEFRQRV